MRSKHTRGHSRGHTGDKVHIPGTKHRSSGLGKPERVSEDHMSRLMKGLAGQPKELRSIYENPYTPSAQQRRTSRVRRLADKPL